MHDSLCKTETMHYGHYKLILHWQKTKNVEIHRNILHTTPSVKDELTPRIPYAPQLVFSQGIYMC